MNNDHVTLNVNSTTCQQAQESELKFAQQTIESDDDWNKWWYDKYERYGVLKNRHFSSVLEVGCGPHTNIRYILPEITFDKLYLEDPLVQYYTTYSLNKPNSLIHNLKKKFKKERVNYLVKIFSDLNINVDLSSSKLEDLPYKDQQMDLVICINVLDHVNNYEQCMQEIFRVLDLGGLLILGQDLSNQEDLAHCPESYTDIGHPIKIDHLILEQTFTGKYHKIFEKILPRDEGRNPKAHYATYLGILQKCTH